jgi:DNA recombination protein RmuC
MDIIFLIIGLLIGGIAAFFIAKYKFSSEKGVSPDEINNLNSQVSDLKTGLGKAEERNLLLGKEIDERKSELTIERNKSLELTSTLSKKNADYDNLKTRLEDQKAELETLQSKFIKEFENLANKILEDKSDKFTKLNKDNIDGLIKPLREKLTEFETTVNRVHVDESKMRGQLIEQLNILKDLNKQVTEETTNLTKALKGDTKTQGSWGEFILERVLEKSGLTKGREYEVQSSSTNDDGKRLRPDVTIFLPDDKILIVDSKVSLTAYEQFASAVLDADRAMFLKNHLRSVKNHIKELSGKKYPDIHSSKSPDFVLMFMAVEPAFALAVQNDPDIFTDAFNTNIVIVSPTTLLATLRTVASIWVQEKQNRNAQEIAKRGGLLYDKFCAFFEDLKEVQKQISKSGESIDKAINKLSSGRGNLINQVHDLKKLGANATKSLPDDLIQLADENENLSLNGQ